MFVLREFWKEEKGQELTEYSLIIAFVALACFALLGMPAPTVRNIWTTANSKIVNASVHANGG